MAEEPKRKRGRPRKEEKSPLTPEIQLVTESIAPAKTKPGPKIKEFNYAQVEGMGRILANQRELALFFQCSKKTIERRMDHDDPYYDPLFVEAYERGCGQTYVGLKRKQIELALDGDRTMLIWLGKNLLGQTDKVEQTHGFDLRSLAEKYSKATGHNPDELTAKALEILDKLNE